MENSFLIMMFQGKIGLGNDLGAVVSLHLEAPRVLSQLHIMLFRHQLSLETFSHKIVHALNFVLNHLTRPRLNRIPIVGKMHLEQPQTSTSKEVYSRSFPQLMTSPTSELFVKVNQGKAKNIGHNKLVWSRK